MSYAMAGKIVGYQRNLYGYAGLGDASYDAALQAYNVAHAQWVLDKQNYDQAMAAWQAQAAAAANAYTQAMAIFQMNMAQWQVESAQYATARAAYENQLRTNAMTTSMAQNAVLAQYPSIVIPAGYAGCVTQAQHNAWAQTCAAQQAIKGLGDTSPTGPACGLALLPVCQTLSAPAPLRAKPIAPPAPNPPLAPAPIGPEPAPPPAPPPPQQSTPAPTPATPPPSVLTPSYTVPDSLPLPTPSTTPAAATASAGLLSNGLLLIVLAGGSYALYRTFKKPKKAA